MEIDLSSNEPTLYLYSRVSTEKQTKNGKKGLARQQDSDDVVRTIERYIDMPIKRLCDEGLSAHHGVNISKGELGKFIDMCRNGEIAPGSVIAMEALDRFTRLNLTRASSLTLSVLEADVKIYTWSTNQTFHRDNMSDAIMMIMQLEGANQYSKNLSSKVVGAAMIRIQDALDPSKRSSKGFCPAVRGYGQPVWWADTTSGYVLPHEFYFPIAQEIAKLIIDTGWGHQKICEYLTEKGYKPPRNKKKWGVNMISKFHLKGQIIGEVTFTNNKEGTTYTIPNYYPKVVNEKDYQAILARKKKNKAKRDGEKSYTGLFAGHEAFRCGFCGAGISVFKGRAEHHKYKCNRMYDPSSKCEGVTTDARYVDTAIIKLIGTVITQKPKIDNSSEIFKVVREQKKLSDQLDSSSVDFGQTKSNTVRKLFIEKMDKIGIEIERLDEKLKELKSVPVADKLSINTIPANIIDYKQVEMRDEITNKVFTHVKKITINIYKNLIDIHVELYSGVEIQACLIDRKVLFFKDENLFNIYHESDDGFGGVEAMSAAENWFGEDKDGNEIRLFTNLTGFNVDNIKPFERIAKKYSNFLALKDTA